MSVSSETLRHSPPPFRLGSLLIWQHYMCAIAAAETRALSSAQLVTAHVQWMVQVSDQALRRVDDAIGDSPIGSIENSVADIGNAVGDLPEVTSILSTTRKDFCAIPASRNAVGIEVADRGYFQRLSKGNALSISPRLDKRVTGQRVFIVARRIERNRRFHGVANMTIQQTPWANSGTILNLVIIRP